MSKENGGPAFEIEDLYSEEGRHFFAKGWHDKQVFADTLTEWGEPGVTRDAVLHCYGGVHIAQTDEGPANCLRVFDEPGRRRFKMTYWDSIDVDSDAMLAERSKP